MRRLSISFAMVLLVSASALAQSPAAKVTDLAWLTGHYKGNTGNGSLEENWAEPSGGSIAALVRSTSEGATNMIELIVIEEEANSLTLRIKQWNPGMQPRAEGFQAMKLAEIGDNHVAFKSSGGEGIQQLGYTLNGNDFTISVTTAQGAFDIPLTRQSGH